MSQDLTQFWPEITTAPRLAGSTGKTYCTTTDISQANETPTSEFSQSAPHSTRNHNNESNFFKSAQWTPDGTTLLTHSEDRGLRTFVIPPDLLVDSPLPKHLQPYTCIFSASTVYATAIYPFAELAKPETFVFLASPRDQPIHLHSLLHPKLINSYNLINPMNEKYETPQSLLIPEDKPHTFIAGTESKINIFDIHRDGGGPIRQLKTTPTRRSPATSTTMKGLVSALAIDPVTKVLAAGTFSRHIGLYADDGYGDVIGVFQLPEGEGEDGSGVTQLLWSKYGKYLYIVERMSDKIDVYDIRVTGKRLNSLRGRKAFTNQRMSVDIAPSGEIIAGGADGKVRMWDVDKGTIVGEWQAHNDVVSSAALHPYGTVMATCSGQRHNFGLPGLGLRKSSEPGSSDESETSSDEDSDSEEEQDRLGPWDNTLRIWEIPNQRNLSDSTVEVGLQDLTAVNKVALEGSPEVPANR